MKSEPGFARGVCLKLLWLAGLVALLQGCATTQSPVQVFYATDRARVASFEGGSTYGTGRGAMNYGTCYVDIPKDHRTGTMGSSLDADTDVVLMKVWPQEATNFFSALNLQLKASHDKDAFIFIHGYNVTFDAAARRTAQMAYDLSFKGVPVFYSWPSRGNYLEYLVDEANIEWTQFDLQHFLNDFVNKTDTENIYLIAHSMGSRALTRALGGYWHQTPPPNQKFVNSSCAPRISMRMFLSGTLRRSSFQPTCS